MPLREHDPSSRARRVPKRLETDARFRTELEYCIEQGIPHSVFLGRAVKPGDQLWLDEDREKVIAYKHWRALHCPRCQTKRDEWDPDKGGSRTAYIAWPDRCPGCEVLDSTQEQIRNSEMNSHGLTVGLLPEGDPRLEEQDDEEGGDT